MKNRKKIVAILLLLVVVLLGGASVFVAFRLNTQKPVAPTAPASRPKAAEQCSSVGGNCYAASCPTGKNEYTADGCGSGEKCCIGEWVGSAVCKSTFLIAAPACEPRPACLDLPKNACKPPEPAGGWCPYLTCGDGKTAYKDVTDNSPGSYLMDEANRMASGATLNPGQVFVYKIGFKTASQVTDSKSNVVASATIEDVLDSRLTFVDAVDQCTVTGNKVSCIVDKTMAAADSKVAFRVKVKEDSSEGILPNVATISSSYSDTSGAVGSATSKTMCFGDLNVAIAPTVKISCKKKSTLNEAGTGIISSIGKSQVFTYSMDIANTGNAPAPEVIVTDKLAEGKLVFVESASGCTFDEATKTVSCKLSLNANETKKVSFKVKTAADVTDGEMIENKAIAKAGTSTDTTTGSECAKDISVALPNLTATKKAYRDNTNNKAGEYHLTDVIDTVSKNQTFVYAIDITNSGTGTASGININDPLSGEGQDQLSFVDKDTRCEWAVNEKLVKCTMDLKPGESSRIAFRAKVSDSVANGAVIKNIGKVSHQGTDIDVTKDLTVSTVVACNHTCTTDAECESGFVCETTAKKCRKPDCTSADSCVCPATITEAPRSTPRPTAVATAAPTRRPTAEPTEEPVEEELPDTGILDLPGVAIFGGGLLLAVVGILLAL